MTTESNPVTPVASYDGFDVFVVTDLTTLTPDIGAFLLNLKLGLNDELICLVRRVPK